MSNQPHPGVTPTTQPPVKPDEAKPEAHTNK